jgi:hypothetical protein
VKDFFKRSDFVEVYTDINISQSHETNRSNVAVHSANIANKKLNALIKSWPVVHSTEPCNFWAKDTVKQFVDPEITHKARLAFIEPIVKEPCKHRVRLNSFSWVDSETKEVLAKTQMTSHCELCGVELVAEWKAK